MGRRGKERRGRAFSVVLVSILGATLPAATASAALPRLKVSDAQTASEAGAAEFTVKLSRPTRPPRPGRLRDR